MVRKLNPIIVQSVLKNKGFSVFSPQEFERIFDVSQSAAQKFIHNYTQKNFFTKIRNGLYALSEKRPNLYFVANKVYAPSYVSLETALSYYGIIPETIYSITSVTTKAKREFEVFGMSFTYTRIKREAFQGYTTQKKDDKTFFIAEPEKALADYLYLVALGKKSWNDRFETKNISKDKLGHYLNLFDRPKLKEFITKL
jgi:predicted transcriptional regulator of viral defense system